MLLNWVFLFKIFIKEFVKTSKRSKKGESSSTLDAPLTISATSEEIQDLK